MQIIDFEHDDLVTPINGHTKALITVLQKNVLVDANTSLDGTGGSKNTEKGYMNSTAVNNTGWNTCARRGWCNNGYYNALSNNFRSLVKQVKKSTAARGDTSSPTWYANHDYCFFISEFEIKGNSGSLGSAETGINTTHTDVDANNISITMPAGGTEYLYFTIRNNRIKYPKQDSSSDTVSSVWWLRSPLKNTSDDFNIIWNNLQELASYDANFLGGLAPACCL